MSEDKFTVGHYATHPRVGGYQPAKANELNTQDPPQGTIPTGHWSCPVESNPSDLELRIRKDIMEDVEKLYDHCVTNHIDSFVAHSTEPLLLRIKDRLNLLWGSNE